MQGRRRKDRQTPTMSPRSEQEGRAGGGRRRSTERGLRGPGSGTDISRSPVQHLPGTGSALIVLPRWETRKAPRNPRLTPLPACLLEATWHPLLA